MSNKGMKIGQYYAIQSNLSKTILCTQMPDLGTLLYKHMLMMTKFAYLQTFFNT